jgi:6-phosphogluconolactonase (cycloisomerase 2 family)
MSIHRVPQKHFFVILAIALAVLASATMTFAQAGTAPQSRVFTETNAAVGNAILVYNRSTTDGSLTLAQTVPTRQNGTGAFLQEQGALLIVSHFLLAVNAGSNSISVLEIGGSTVRMLANYNSGGTFPKSLTAYKNFVYVLNQGGAGNITGFTIDETSGVLTPIAGSTQPLSGMSDPQPEEIGFVKNGVTLIVTERNTNVFDLYPVSASGVAGAPTAYGSTFPNPCGFATGKDGWFFLSLAYDAIAKNGSVASYMIGARHSPNLLTGGAGTFQSGTCWIVVNSDSTVLWAADNASNAVTPFYIDSTGVVSPNFGFTLGTPSSPYDMAISGDNQYVYVLYLNPAQIVPYTVQDSMQLIPGQGVSVSTSVAAGLVVR